MRGHLKEKRERAEESEEEREEGEPPPFKKKKPAAGPSELKVSENLRKFKKLG